MKRRNCEICAIVLLVAASVRAQDPLEETIAKNKRMAEALKHPTFITLRLESVRRGVPNEEPSTTPSPYTVGAAINFQLFISQSLSEELVLTNQMWPYLEYRPELNRDGDVVPYSKKSQEFADQAEARPVNSSVMTVHLARGSEHIWGIVDMDEWYEPLVPGHYQLVARKRFYPDGEWVESNPVTFDVIPRRPAAPIPDGLKVRLVPSDSKSQPSTRPYRLGNQGDVDILLINKSAQPVRVSVIDVYYGHRLQLFKDGRLIPYREEATKLIESKDTSSRLVDVVSDFFIEPKTTRTEGLRLKDWYGPLPPGRYRLLDRRRFEIDGPWTADSTELWFEISPRQ